jgi:hypothetical protein
MRSSHKTQSIRPSRSTRLRVAPVDGCPGWKRLHRERRQGNDLPVCPIAAKHRDLLRQRARHRQFLSPFRQNATVAHFVMLLRKGRQRSIADGTTFQRFVGDSVRERGGVGVAGAPARLEQFGAGPATKRPTMPGPIHACDAAAVADACPRFRNRPRLTKLELAADDRIAVATIRSIQPTGWPGESRHGDGVTVLGTPADQFYRRFALGYAAVERLVCRR